jgi:hypothetical protein
MTQRIYNVCQENLTLMGSAPRGAFQGFTWDIHVSVVEPPTKFRDGILKRKVASVQGKASRESAFSQPNSNSWPTD